MLAYALFIGVRQILLWGADYSHEKSKRREEDRANAEYWIGICRVLGMRILIPDTSTLCNADKGTYFYGYRDKPQLDQTQTRERRVALIEQTLERLKSLFATQ